MTPMADDGWNKSVARLTNYSLFPIICLYVAASWSSLFFVVDYYGDLLNLARPATAEPRALMLAAAPFALPLILFALTPFSFGYAVSFYLYAILLGYASLLPLSQYPYNHLLAY